MGVDVTHLVLEPPSNANDQVVDDGFDSAKCSDVLAGTMMQFDIDKVLRRMREAHRKMGHVLDKFPCTHPIQRVACWVLFRRGSIPRGPSTVTIRDLMWILTVKLSVSVSWRHKSYVLDVNFTGAGGVAISN